MNKGHVIILVGKSASGKDTIQNELVKRFGFEPLVSTTSRPMREGEKEGLNYYYISKDEFQKRIAAGDFLEYREYHTLVNGQPETWYYGMEKRNLNGEYVTVLDLEGAEAFVKYYGKQNCSVVHVVADDVTRETRARMRGSFDEQEWNRRLADDAIKFSPEQTMPGELVDYAVQNNDDLQAAVDKIATLEYYRMLENEEEKTPTNDWESDIDYDEECEDVEH